MHITELVPGDLLDEMLREGYVRATPHPTESLTILGYTEKAQFERRWNDVTTGLRGVIIDADGNVIARPWSKFFNLGEGNVIIDFEMPAEVTDKIDGSLGILYKSGDPYEQDPREWRIATRGSFASEQAIHATKVWQERYGHLEPPMDWTFLFEIVYPANRIVLNYGDLDDLILLGAVHKERGWYIGPREAQGYLGWEGPITQTFEYKTMREAFEAPYRKNAEGFVIRSGSKMMKIKQSDYVELHRIVTNLNARTVWDLMRQGKSLADICEPIPDEWHDWVKATYTDIEKQLHDKIEEVVVEYALIKPGLDRKSFAMIASKSANKAYLFKMYDGKSIKAAVLDTLKPDVSKE
jgi:RNA ligase